MIENIEGVNMKYTIERMFSLKNKKFEINCDGKSFCTAIAIPSKDYEGLYDIKISNPINKYIGEDICLVEPNPRQEQSYLIYLQNGDNKYLYGQLFNRLDRHGDCIYTIIIGNKSYRTQSSVLKHCRLTIIDAISADSSQPKTLFQVAETFSKSNEKYHVSIYDKAGRYAYLAIVILLHLHERQRN